MKLAVFLLAGGGIRLKPYTNDIPKCLVPVNDQKLLIRMLDLLQLGGIEKVILVIGFKGEKIQYLIGDQYGDMAVQYIHNEVWETTNNVVSLNLAVPRIKEDFILLEGDLIFTWDAFKNMLLPDRIAVDNYKSFMDGTLVDIDKNNNVIEFILKSNKSHKADIHNLYKTVNIYSFSYDSFEKFVVPNLNNLIDSGQKQVYYEQAIAQAVSENKYLLKAINFNKTAWYEIDTEEDLINAENLFSDINS
ncbi:sugar phosphate nucleotidyltransferase [Candidatus Neomarinimicrobiota bacterium]